MCPACNSRTVAPVVFPGGVSFGESVKTIVGFRSAEECAGGERE